MPPEFVVVLVVGVVAVFRVVDSESESERLFQVVLDSIRILG